MFDHILIRVASFTTALRFYTAALAPLGYVPQYVDEAAKSAGFGPQGAVGLWIAQGSPAARIHIALRSPSRAAVGAFHAAAMRAGAQDNGGPGLRPDYGSTYYAAFVFDPDGNNLEALTCETA